MAFSMDQLKIEKKQKIKKVYSPEVFAWVNGLEQLSNNTKIVLNKYFDVRFKTFGPYQFNIEQYKYMIKDLLKHCCGKEFIDITPQDTDNNITEIAFQLKWAIERNRKDKRTLYNKTLYRKQYKASEIAYQQNLAKPPERLDNGKLTEEGIANYFKDVRWL